MQLDFHPVANIFPLMTGAEYDALVSDIAEHGQREAIWLHTDGRIIDGRNRYRACCDIGLVPECKTWDGSGSLIAFVVSLNLHRRHLTSSQRAVVALDILPMLEAEARERQLATLKQNTDSQLVDYREKTRWNHDHESGIVEAGASHRSPTQPARPARDPRLLGKV